MKKLTLSLLLAGGILLPVWGQQDWPQMDQMQKEMFRFFEEFNRQFDPGEGGMLLDTMIMKPFFFGMPEEGGEMLPEDFSQQLSKMMEQMMRSFGDIPGGQGFPSGELEELLKNLQEQLPPGFAIPPPPGSEGLPGKKRKTFTL